MTAPPSSPSALAPHPALLDPAALARIANLELVARGVVDGFLSGLHRAPHLGMSLDFAEHRAYMPGDDIRRIDWKLFGRTDRFYLKEFEADTNTDMVVFLDQSASMRFGGALSKLDYGRMLAAVLLVFSNRQRDRVGLALFDDELRELVPPSAKHLHVALHSLERLTSKGRAGVLEPPLRKVAASLRRRGIRVLISDFYEDPESVISAANALRGNGSEVILFHLLDPAELLFPAEDAASFKDLETGEQIPVVPSQLRERYRELINTHISTLRRRARESRIDYTMLETSRPLGDALFAFLSHRLYTARVRAWV